VLSHDRISVQGFIISINISAGFGLEIILLPSLIMMCITVLGLESLVEYVSSVNLFFSETD
jgi:hypothetical protein